MANDLNAGRKSEGYSKKVEILNKCAVASPTARSAQKERKHQRLQLRRRKIDLTLT